MTQLNLKQQKLCQEILDFKKANQNSELKFRCMDFNDKYPDCTPVIMLKHKRSKLPVLRDKILIKSDYTLSVLQQIVKSQLLMKEDQSLFLTIKGDIVTQLNLQLEAFHPLKDEDGLLYIIYSEMSSFG